MSDYPLWVSGEGTQVAGKERKMWHGILDSLRNHADKILDNALVLLSNTFLLVFGIHYRNHLLRRKNETREFADRHSATEEQIRELRDRMDSEKRGKAQGDDSGETGRQEDGVDSKPDSGNRHRARSHRKQDV